MGGCGQESLLCSKSLNLRRAEDVCSESGEDSRSIFSSDGWGEYPKNPGSGPPLLRSKRSRVVMGARSVGRERRSSLVLLDRGKSNQRQEAFTTCSETVPEKEPSNRKKFFNFGWMKRWSGKKEKKVEKEAVVAGASVGKGSVVAELCDTCQGVSEDQRSSSQLFGSYEMKVVISQSSISKCIDLFYYVLLPHYHQTGWGGEWRGGEARWGGDYCPKQGAASRRESFVGTGRECCEASLTKMRKQGGEERAAQRCLKHQGQKHQLRHTVSDRNIHRMEGR